MHELKHRDGRVSLLNSLLGKESGLRYDESECRSRANEIMDTLENKWNELNVSNGAHDEYKGEARYINLCVDDVAAEVKCGSVFRGKLINCPCNDDYSKVCNTY